VAGGKIYVGGAFSDAGGALGDHILSFDGTAWSPLGSNGAGNGALNAFVQVVYPLPDGRIAAGGGFTDAGGNIAADFAAIWSPTLATWQTVDGSSTPVFNNSVVALAAQGSRIVFGGFFTNAAGDVRADGVAEWTGKAWLHYGTNVAGTDGALGAGYVRSLAIYRGVTIVGGAFHVDGVPAAVNLGAWSGSRWFPLGTPALDEGFLDLQPVGRTLYASGFSSNIAGISSADFIAAFGLPGVASSPRSLVATAGVRRVTLKWAAPATTSGSGPVRDYVVQYRRSGTTAWKTFADGVKATTGATVTGLAPGTTYQFRVLAKTDWGTGAYSAVVAKKAN